MAEPLTVQEAVDALRLMRDQLTARYFGGFGHAGKRSISMMLTRIDEAVMWGENYMVEQGDLVRVSRDQARRALDAVADRADATVTTVTTPEREGVNSERV